MKRNHTTLLAIGLIVMGAAARIINHESHLFNLAPVAAIGLFSGAVIKDKRISYIIPLLCMLFADLYIELFTTWSGFYGIEQLFVYAPLALITYLGTRMKSVNSAAPKAYSLNVLGYAVSSSMIFFIVSNFGSFLSGMYGFGVKGLLTTYVAAIPFYQNTLASDIIGSGLLFGAYFLVQRSLTAQAQKA